MFMLFDTGTFWVLPLTYLYIPKSARAYLFPQCVKVHYLFCSGPVSVDPICPPPRLHPGRGQRTPEERPSGRLVDLGNPLLAPQ